MNQPLLSIVIANYNYGRFLGEAIESVVSQMNDAGEGMVELIICDGGSTDNSVEVIKKYEKYLTWWCSEKDRGQSHAFNKGFSHAKGQFLTWLNADDVMFPGVVKALKKAVEKHPSQEWFVGGSFWMDPEMRVWKCYRARPFSKIRAKCGNVSVWGPSSFFTKRLLDEVGGVDERFHYMMDSELWCRFYYKGKTKYLPFVDYAYGLRLHPNAKMSGHNFTESEHKNPDHPKWRQIKFESDFVKANYSTNEFSLLMRIVSISFIKRLCGVMDTLRFKNKHYKKCFERRGF